MSWLPICRHVAQISVERILNALPEGLLIALFAWALLRVLRRQNSGTRFAVWFLALLTVAALPVLAASAKRELQLARRATSWGSTAARDHHSRLLGAFRVSRVGAGGEASAMIRLAVGLWRLRQLRRSCTPIVDDDGSRSCVAKDAGCDRSAGLPGQRSRLRRRSTCACPAAIGFWKRTIVLPAWTLRELPPKISTSSCCTNSRTCGAGDDWTNLIQKIVRALFFFHPAVWWIEGRFRWSARWLATMRCSLKLPIRTDTPACLVSLLEKSVAHRFDSNRQTMVDGSGGRPPGPRSLAAAGADSRHEPSQWPRESGSRRWPWPAFFPCVCLMAAAARPQIVAFDRKAVLAIPIGSAVTPLRLNQSLLAQPAMQLGSDHCPRRSRVGDTIAPLPQVRITQSCPRARDPQALSSSVKRSLARNERRRPAKHCSSVQR